MAVLASASLLLAPPIRAVDPAVSAPASPLPAIPATGAEPTPATPANPPVSLRAPGTPEEHSPFEEPQLVNETLILSEPPIPSRNPPSIQPESVVLPQAINLKDTIESPWRLRIIPVFQIQSTFDDNIFIQKKNRESDFYHTIQAGLALGFGEFRDQMNALGAFQQGYEGLRSPEFEERNFVFASYTPGYTLFTDHTGESTVLHTAEFGMKWSFNRLTTGLNASFRRFTEAFVDTSSREVISRLQVELPTKYAFSEKTSFEADLYHFSNFFENDIRINSSEWIDQNYLNYQIRPKTTVSAGLRLGYLQVETGPSQTYEQAVVRVKYNPEGKFQGDVFGGVEFRQFEGDAGDAVNPVFGLSASYTPVDPTTFTLFGLRQIVSSANQVGTNVISTSVSLSIRQRLFQKTFLTLLGAYEQREYDPLVGNFNREDEVFTASLEYSFHVTKWTQVSLSYGFWKNDSSSENLSFYDNRASIRFDFLF